MKKLSQRSFLLIQEYKNEIEENTQHLGKCKGWSKKQILEKEQEFIAEGLARKTKLEMVRLELFKPELILEYIKRIEEELINLFPHLEKSPAQPRTKDRLNFLKYKFNIHLLEMFKNFFLIISILFSIDWIFSFCSDIFFLIKLKGEIRSLVFGLF